MMTQEKFRDKKHFDVLWPPLSSALCTVYQHYVSTHQQKRVLSRKEQSSPSINDSCFLIL